jgi:hypothetical protein
MSILFILIAIQDRNAMRNHIMFDHPTLDVYMTPCSILYASNRHSRRAEEFICRHRLCLPDVGVFDVAKVLHNHIISTSIRHDAARTYRCQTPIRIIRADKAL